MATSNEQYRDDSGIGSLARMMATLYGAGIVRGIPERGFTFPGVGVIAKPVPKGIAGMSVRQAWGVTGGKAASGGAAGATKMQAYKVLGARTAAMGLSLFSWYIAAELGILAGKGLFALGKAHYKAVRGARRLELGGYFPQTQAAHTSRQRTVQAITASRLQARSAIGSEAFLMHR